MFNLSSGIQLISGFANSFASISSARAKAADIRATSQLQAQAAILSGEAANQLNVLNALIYEDNARVALEAAKEDMMARHRQSNQDVGMAAATYAANGVVISRGTPLLVLQNLAAQGEMEAVKMKQRGEVDALNFRNKAIIERFAGQQAIVTGQVNAQIASALGEMQASEVERQANREMMSSIGNLFGSFGFGGGF